MSRRVDWILDRAISQRDLIALLTAILFQMEDVYSPAEQLSRCRQAIEEYASQTRE
jgi:hypothetical protein